MSGCSKLIEIGEKAKIDEEIKLLKKGLEYAPALLLAKGSLDLKEIFYEDFQCLDFKLKDENTIVVLNKSNAPEYCEKVFAKVKDENLTETTIDLSNFKY